MIRGECEVPANILCLGGERSRKSDFVSLPAVGWPDGPPGNPSSKTPPTSPLLNRTLAPPRRPQTSFCAGDRSSPIAKGSNQ